MLFNSPAFMFGFLPITLLGFFVCARWSRPLALGWLTVASLVFYAWWNPLWLPLLLLSIGFNFGVGIALAAPPGGRMARLGLSRSVLLAIGVGVNLGLLGYFKYRAFAMDVVAQLLCGAGAPWPAGQGAAAAAQLSGLPLGISFFTFTQIAFIVDVWRRRATDHSPLRYGLFVTYFPHLIAGPILHHQEMMPQFARPDIFAFDPGRLADGLTIFMLGLFKKVVLADRYASYATPAFDAARNGDPSFFASWGAALGYTLQLYFDFSGYCDMAIGLALMIGVQLPLNFHSPYKALDIADFWRRWHMTLSRFLRDYLYIPLGGSRRGPARRNLNLLTTMLLGGLWHGAAWTFLFWGGLHGLYLVAHRGWRSARACWFPSTTSWCRLPAAAACWLLTFLAVVWAWVFFRAADLRTALRLTRGMLGLNGSLLPDQIISVLPWLARLARPVGQVPALGDGTVMGGVEMALMIPLGLAIVGFAPSMHELRAATRCWLLVPCSALACQAVLFGSASPFLYFQF